MEFINTVTKVFKKKVQLNLGEQLKQKFVQINALRTVHDFIICKYVSVKNLIPYSSPRSQMCCIHYASIELQEYLCHLHCHNHAVLNTQYNITWTSVVYPEDISSNCCHSSQRMSLKRKSYRSLHLQKDRCHIFLSIFDLFINEYY